MTDPYAATTLTIFAVAAYVTVTALLARARDNTAWNQHVADALEAADWESARRCGR